MSAEKVVQKSKKHNQKCDQIYKNAHVEDESGVHINQECYRHQRNPEILHQRKTETL